MTDETTMNDLVEQMAAGMLEKAAIAAMVDKCGPLEDARALWAARAAAVIPDALTLDDLLTLAGLVGDDAPFETVGRLRTCLYDAADIIEFETQSPDTGLVADLKQAAQTLVEGPDR